MVGINQSVHEFIHGSAICEIDFKINNTVCIKVVPQEVVKDMMSGIIYNDAYFKDIYIYIYRDRSVMFSAFPPCQL